MNWQEQIDKKETELNIKKEVENVCIGSNSNISSHRGNGSGLSLSKERGKSINNVTAKGGNRMITVEGALKDLEDIEKGADGADAKAIVKAFKVVVKFLSTMRSNQLLTEADKVGIRKVKETRVAKEVK